MTTGEAPAPPALQPGGFPAYSLMLNVSAKSKRIDEWRVVEA